MQEVDEDSGTTFPGSDHGNDEEQEQVQDVDEDFQTAYSGNGRINSF